MSVRPVSSSNRSWRGAGSTPLIAQAVLFRSAAHSARLEIELTRRNLPFVKFGGLKFLEARHVKDACWPSCAGDRTCVTALPVFVPCNSCRVSARRQPGASLDNLQAAPPGCLARRTAGGGRRAGRTAGIRRAGRRAGAGRSEGEGEEWGGEAGAWPLPLEKVARWYEAQMDRLFDDAEVRRGDIQQLARIAATYPNRERFLTELTLDPPEPAATRRACRCATRTT